MKTAAKTEARLPRVLFVDDEPQVLEGLRCALRKQRRSWDMVFAEGGAAALDVLQAGPVEILCTDMRMPGMDGAELLARVRVQSPRTGRFVLSGYAEEKRLATCLALAHHFFHKPFEVTLLVPVLQRGVALQALIHDETLLAGPAAAPEALAYMRLTELLAGGRACHTQAVEIIEESPTLAAKVGVLGRLAGAPSIATMGELVERLGLETVRALALFAEFLLEAEREAGDTPELRQAVRRAVVAARIARRFLGPAKEAHDAFAAGLLCGVGRLLPEAAAGARHAELAARRLWPLGLSLAVIEAVALHHGSDRLPQRAFDLPSAVHVAAALAYGEPVGGLDRARIAALGLAQELDHWCVVAREEAAAVQ